MYVIYRHGQTYTVYILDSIHFLVHVQCFVYTCIITSKTTWKLISRFHHGHFMISASLITFRIIPKAVMLRPNGGLLKMCNNFSPGNCVKKN